MKIVFEDSGAGDLRNFIIQLCHIPNGRCRTRYLGWCIIFDDWQFGNSGLSQTDPITVNIIFNLILYDSQNLELYFPVWWGLWCLRYFQFAHPLLPLHSQESQLLTGFTVPAIIYRHLSVHYVRLYVIQNFA